MNSDPVVFIAFEEFDNLGIGYLSSVLSENGYRSSVIDIRDGKEEILNILLTTKPLIVGFSVIFQYHIYEFEELIIFLRRGGIECHFTAGGQYASMRYEELLNIIPSLDSIVRFDGEYTFLELVNCISSGKNWKEITGIVYKNNNQVIVNRLRTVEKDLDKFPLPMRSPLKEYAFGRKFATILAGRGCIYNCSFCYLREYYNLSTGPVKRIRKPEKVVWEIELLHHKMDCSVFLFQDDDFPVKTNNGAGWIRKFCSELNSKNLVNNIIWKINCRPDEVNYDSFALMKKHGLFLVFLGIEDGTDIGLVRLNKHNTVAKSVEGINILKTLNIGFDFGFLLFQPWSTFKSVIDNLNFLEEICGDGFSPVTFMKMMPYSGTPVEKELGDLGRLKGKPGFLDYDFEVCALDHYYKFTTDCFSEWLRDPDGIVNVTKWCRNYISDCTHFFEIIPEINGLSAELKGITAESNIFLLNTMKELAGIFESGKYNKLDYNDLKHFKRNIKRKHKFYTDQIRNVILTLRALAEIGQFPQLFANNVNSLTRDNS